MNNLTKTPELRGIFELLVLPLLRKRPDEYSHHDWLDFTWCTSSRVIQRWEVTKTMQLKSRRRIFHDKWFKSKLKLKKGDEIYTRYDTTNPGVIEVEVPKSRGKVDSREYILTENDWRKLEVWLKHCPIATKDTSCSIDWSVLVS